MRAVPTLADAEDRYRLTHAMETALAVGNASQFFAWTQGPLFMLLPHEILVCGHTPQGGRDLQMRYFSATRYFRQEHFETACNPRNGLVTKAIHHWRSVRRPCILPLPNAQGACPITGTDILVRLEMKNMAAHGLLGPDGHVQAWFGFSRVKNLGAHTGLVLELLLPTLAATYARVMAADSAIRPDASPTPQLLTPREIQVLEMVRDGMSNPEIAVRLNLSVLTAKNHMQNIRGKLNVRSRSQAVAEALRLGLLHATSEEV
jgi:transcriptional regulator EpsA